MARCKCTNLTHEHGVHCEREAMEPNDMCEECHKKAAMDWPLVQQKGLPDGPGSS